MSAQINVFHPEKVAIQMTGYCLKTHTRPDHLTNLYRYHRNLEHYQRENNSRLQIIWYKYNQNSNFRLQARYGCGSRQK